MRYLSAHLKLRHYDQGIRDPLVIADRESQRNIDRPESLLEA